MRPAMRRVERLMVLGLGIAGVLPPLALTVRPGELGHVGAVPVSVMLTAVLMLAPALVGLVAALFGLDNVRDGFRARGDREHEQAVLRVFVAALAVAYGFAFALAPAYGDAAASSIVVAALGLAGAWVLLALSLVDPSPSAARHYLGMVYDAALLSVFLHFGGMLTAPWFLLYLLASFYAAIRFGAAALAVASIAGLAGFGAVVASTEFWREQALLAGGLAIALIALPAYVGAMAREVAASRDAAVTAQAARTRFMTVISQGLRAPLDAIIDMGTEPQAPSIVPSARALLSQLNSILDFSAIETGGLVPEVEAFDLHRLVNETVAERRAEARMRGGKLRVHIDPALPYRLRGWRQQFVQIIDNLVPPVNEMRDVAAVRLGIDGAVSDGGIDLRLTLRDESVPIGLGDADAVFDPVAGEGVQQVLGTHAAFRLAVVKRLAALMGGSISVENGAVKGALLRVSLPLEVDEPAVESALDLNRCLVLIATEDGQFASELAEPLNAWHGDPRWIEGFGGTLGFLDRSGAASSVLIVDGRSHVLAALSFAHRAATGPSPPGFIVVVAEPAQMAGFVELADGEVDAVLAAPIDAQLLASALHSLPLAAGATPRPVLVPEAAEPEAEAAPPAVAASPAAAEPQVTPISAHPRFGAEIAVIDPQAMASLHGMGGGDAFLADVIGSFRADAREIMQRIVRAAKMTDPVGFGRSLHLLRNCAANFGAMRLCETLASMREVGARDLREQGDVLVQRIEEELERLDAALAEYLPEAAERQRR